MGISSAAFQNLGKLLLLLLVGLMTSLCPRSALGVEVVDLTYDLGDDTIYWPGNPDFELTIIKRNRTSVGYWYESNSFFTPEHGGTHLDAPAHFAKGQWRSDQIPATHLLGPAVVLDVADKAELDNDYQVTVEDIEDWESVNGRMPDRCIVLMNSGWGRRYPNASLVFNTPTPTLPATFHFPGFHPHAATFLTTQRDVIAVGVDTPSTDFGQSTRFQTHVTLGLNNVLGLESVAHLERLPARGATVIVGAVKLVDGSGAPARILALLGEGSDIFGAWTTGGAGGSGGLWGMVMVVAAVVLLLP